MTRAARRRAWRNGWRETDWGEVLRQQAAAAAAVSAPDEGQRVFRGSPLVYLVPALVIAAALVTWAVIR